MIALLEYLETLGATLRDAMPIDCEGDRWQVKYEGVCHYTQRTDENQTYLYGPIYPTTTTRDFVVLDDQYQVQLAFVVGSGNVQPMGASRAKTTFDVQLVVGSYLAAIEAMAIIQGILERAIYTQVVSIDTNTLANAQRFYQPNLSQFGIDPERIIYVFNLQVTI